MISARIIQHNAIFLNANCRHICQMCKKSHLALATSAGDGYRTGRKPLHAAPARRCGWSQNTSRIGSSVRPRPSICPSCPAISPCILRLTAALHCRGTARDCPRATTQFTRRDRRCDSSGGVATGRTPTWTVRLRRSEIVSVSEAEWCRLGNDAVG